LEKDFIVQEHRAVRAKWHHDLRLEHGGTLKSWAVPKGVPMKAGGKALAIPTADHTKHWMNFQGKIPKGEYGYGTVKIAHKGKYVPKEWKENVIKFEVVKDTKMKGSYTLVKLPSGNWLLMKNKK
jgi:bifunctional non-homologous end joining protein LigD